MKPSALYILILIALLYLLSAQRASAQGTFGYSTLTYDQATNTVRAHSTTYPDYNVQAYYSSKAAIGLSSWNPDGSDLVYHGGETIEGPYYGTAEADAEAPYTPGRIYSSGSDHYHKTIYEEWFYPPNEWMEPELRSVDYYNFYSYEGSGSTISYEYSHYWHGPGPRYLLDRGTQDIYLGGTLLTLEAAPVITSLSPDRGLIGDVIDVTITGQRLGNPQNSSLTTVNVPANSGITVSNVRVNSKTEVIVRFTIDTTSNGGNKQITLKYLNQTSNAVHFYVQIPTSLTGPNSLGSKRTYNGQPLFDANNVLIAATFYGYTHAFRYSVKDQAGLAIISPNMTQTELVQFVRSHNNVSTDDRTTTSPVRENSGFDDLLTFGFIDPPAPQPGHYLKQKQTIYISLVGGGFSGIVRVNCLNKQYDDVSIMDITATPDASCQ